MYRFRLPLPAKLKPRLIIIWLISLIIIVSLLWSLYFTYQSVEYLNKNNFAKAAQAARSAQPFPRVLSTATLHLVAEVEIWRTSLIIIGNLDDLETNARELVGQLSSPEEKRAQPALIDFENTWRAFDTDLYYLTTNLEKSVLFKNTAITEKIAQYSLVSQDLALVLHELTSSSHSLLVLFQNTEEMRATGGFMGSYARINLVDGQIGEISIQDIYEPDGQFTGFVEAPPGANEYLSEGKGLRLPDSNWHPDLPSAAPQILTYFAYGNERKIDSLMVINVDLMQQVLAVVGEIYLPDYGLTVTADNLTALARADRNSFFAGSKGKPLFLSSLWSHLKLKLTQLNSTQQLSLINVLRQAFVTKDAQFFSSNIRLQELAEKHGLAGQLKPISPENYFFAMVESNVGINKANKNIDRKVNFFLQPGQANVTINFTNSIEESRLDYFNYHRLILTPDTKISNLKINGQNIESDKINIEQITNSLQQSFTQIGFLVIVPMGETREVSFDLFSPTLCQDTACAINIFKQAGLAPTLYELDYAGTRQSLILEKDELIQFSEL